MIKFLFASLTLFCLPLAASAALLSVEATPHTIGIGNVVRISVSVSSDESVNTFSGTLIYPSGILEPILISDGNSIIPLWLEHPKKTEGAIPFAGLTPGGFVGKNGKLFSVIFRAKAAGPASFSITSPQTLLNDGRGTNASTTAQSASLTITTDPGETYLIEEDTTPPQPFDLGITQQPDKQNYLIFTAVDKGSGIQRFEVREWRRTADESVWVVTESPYKLVDQELTSTIEVRAIDNMGNTRYATLPSSHLLKVKERYAAGALGAMIALLFAYAFLRSRTDRFSPLV